MTATGILGGLCYITGYCGCKSQQVAAGFVRPCYETERRVRIRSSISCTPAGGVRTAPNWRPRRDPYYKPIKYLKKRKPNLRANLAFARFFVSPTLAIRMKTSQLYSFHFRRWQSDEPLLQHHMKSDVCGFLSSLHCFTSHQPQR